ncbi:MAG: thymidine phosphorylase, partial [Dethiobacteria bacterium]
MLVTEIITKKRDGCKLNEKEIAYLISSYNVGKLPDYQMAAFLMAVFFQGLDITETVLLTKALIDSGEKLDLSEVGGFVVDKHSSGGVGDKTTLVLAPLVAACGVKMAKMSGRGLGHTGGTIDKLNSIPGFRTALSMQEFIAIIKKCGVAISGQSADLTPADGKLYALRDVTGTVESIPLIASSIISKKIAAGAHGIILDVKIGSGAFMKSNEKAFELAEILVRIGQKLGRTVKVILTDMHQPLGYTIGNALEVKEAIRTLKGKGPEDLKKLVLELAKELLLIAGKTEEEAEALKIVEENLS